LAAVCFIAAFMANTTAQVPASVAGSKYGTVYVPDQALPISFGIQLMNNDTYLKFTSRYTEPEDYFPMIIWTTNFANDQWSKSALLSDDSIDMFLKSDFHYGNTRYLFLASQDQQDIYTLQAKIAERAAKLGLPDDKMNRILYGNYSIDAPEFQADWDYLTDILDQWQSYVSYVSVSFTDSVSGEVVFINSSRLDCYWPNCESPEELVDSYSIIDIGDACKVDGASLIDIYGDDFASAILLGSTEDCDYETAALNMANTGALGSILMASAADDVLTQLNKAGEVYLESYATMISFEDGMRLRNALTGNVKIEASQAEVSFTYELRQGYFLVIDGQNKIQQVGAPLNAMMMIASWAGQYEAYKDELHDSLMKEAVVVPVIDSTFMPASSADIKISQDLLSSYGKMEVDMRLYCRDSYDETCSAWDHTLTLKVSCAEGDTDDVIPNAALESESIDMSTKGKEMAKEGEPESARHPMKSQAFATHIADRSLRGEGASATHEVKASLAHARADMMASYWADKADESFADTFGITRSKLSTKAMHAVSQLMSESSSSSSSSSSRAASSAMQHSTSESPSEVSHGHMSRRLEVGGSQNELARYVTPFGRRVGHWLTDATQLMPLLADSQCEAFHFEVTDGGGVWMIDTSLRFTERELAPPTDYTSLFAFHSYMRKSINENKTLSGLVAPASARKAELQAIISTHGYDSYGCCEFLPTRHIFTVNGDAYTISFDEAGTEFGCADMAKYGSEPNEYGTWVYGRGGWCDGMDVKPWILDVSSSILGSTTDSQSRRLSSESADGGGEFEVSYHTEFLFNGTWMSPVSETASGYVLLSSHLVYYVDSDASSGGGGSEEAVTSVTAGGDEFVDAGATAVEAGASGASVWARMAVTNTGLAFVCFLVGMVATAVVLSVIDRYNAHTHVYSQIPSDVSEPRGV
jgi:hypothetical protein